MSNSLSPPLEIRHDQIDPGIREAIRRIDQIARVHDTKYFLTGAMAREIVLRHVFGRPAGRRTLDVDFGISVSNWDHFRTLKLLLEEQASFTPDPREFQRLRYNVTPPVIVDLIPFGGVERSDRTIAWPPDEDIVMRVAGFDDGLASSVQVRVDKDLVIPVVSIPVLLVLKLFAWVDRKHERRDAPDIYTLLKEYGDAGNEDRLYGEEMRILEAEGYDVELAGARLIGQDAAGVISEDTRKRALEILNSDRRMEQLRDEIIVTSVRSDPGHVSRCASLVTRFREGFLEKSEMLNRQSA
jgi:predicted nucleotidyltransferase